LHGLLRKVYNCPQNGANQLELYWVHGNHLGVPMVTTNALGQVVDPGTDFLRPGFPGQSQVLSDLYYNRARDYDPVLGRYIQADPIGLLGDVNPYLYANGDPVNMMDPKGLAYIGLVLGAADLGLQLYNNGGRLDCINWLSVGGSLIGGGILSGVLKGAFRFKATGSHTWDATRAWMRSREIMPKRRSGDHYHHWLFERNQGIGKHVPDWLKNQPWNLNPMSPGRNQWLGRSPYRAILGAPAWAIETVSGIATSTMGNQSDGCKC
jgi:RHS repeat-associated protein